MPRIPLPQRRLPFRGRPQARVQQRVPMGAQPGPMLPGRPGGPQQPMELAGLDPRLTDLLLQNRGGPEGQLPLELQGLVGSELGTIPSRMQLQPQPSGLPAMGASSAGPMAMRLGLPDAQRASAPVIDAEVMEPAGGVAPTAPSWLKRIVLGALGLTAAGTAGYRWLGDEAGEAPGEEAPVPQPELKPQGRPAMRDPDARLGAAMVPQDPTAFQPDPRLFADLFQMDPLAVQLARLQQQQR